MSTKGAPKPPAAPPIDDMRLPHVHYTRRNGVSTTTEGQGQGPWRRYQLTVNDRQPAPPAKSDGDGTRKLDPATRAGCVPATAYPSFRTIPPAPAHSRQLSSVSMKKSAFWVTCPLPPFFKQTAAPCGTGAIPLPSLSLYFPISPPSTLSAGEEIATQSRRETDNRRLHLCHMWPHLRFLLSHRRTHL